MAWRQTQNFKIPQRASLPVYSHGTGLELHLFKFEALCVFCCLFSSIGQESLLLLGVLDSMGMLQIEYMYWYSFIRRSTYGAGV